MPSVGYAVDVWRVVAHRATIVGANIKIADVVTPDDKDVRFVLRDGGYGENRKCRGTGKASYYSGESHGGRPYFIGSSTCNLYRGQILVLSLCLVQFDAQNNRAVGRLPLCNSVAEIPATKKAWQCPTLR